MKSEDASEVSVAGLHVVYGSRTRKGLSHPNEDRHTVAFWNDWNSEAHLRNESAKADVKSYPTPEVILPPCMGFSRKDTTLSGMGGTGILKDCQTALDLQLGHKVAEVDLTKETAYLWTVCDGHDGSEAAEFVCRRVGDSFSRIWHGTVPAKMPINYLKDKPLAPGENAATFARGYALSNALARTYEHLDQSFKDIVCPEIPGESAVAGSTAGSCVTSIFLSGNLLCCAGLGDCKAAILTLEESETVADSFDTKAAQQQFQVTWFSKEHRSNAPKERARIRARGGWFRHGRIGGVLEPTRTIGDFDVKASQPAGVLIATPEVRTFVVTKPVMVLIASDGVWDVMDASQLLRTLKKRRRLWRGVLTWLGAPVREKRGLMKFGFRKRAKSKEGLNCILQLPTGGDLVAMAEALVTRAHDLGSDDDCTCICIYLRPVQDERMIAQTCDSIPASKRESDMEAEEEDEDDEDELEDDDDLDEGADDNAASCDSSYEYEKWHQTDIPAYEDDQEEENDAHNEKETDEWNFSTNVFPVTGGDRCIEEEAPEILEKARKRREERRAARERRRLSLQNPEEH